MEVDSRICYYSVAMKIEMGITDLLSMCLLSTSVFCFFRKNVDDNIFRISPTPVLNSACLLILTEL